MNKIERDKLREYSGRLKKSNSSPCYVCTDELISLLDSYERLVEALDLIARAHEVKRGACMKDAIAIRARQALALWDNKAANKNKKEEE